MVYSLGILSRHSEMCIPPRQEYSTESSVPEHKKSFTLQIILGQDT